MSAPGGEASEAGGASLAPGAEGLAVPATAPSAALVLATARLLAVAAHPVRLRVLLALDRHGPQSAGALQALAGVEQSAMSHQLHRLRAARLVVAERAGRHVIYRLHDHHVAHIVRDALSHVAELGEPGDGA